MLTAPFVLALALLPAGKPAAMPPKAARPLALVHGLLLKEFHVPPPVSPLKADRGAIEVTVGALPSHVGGPPDEGVLKAARVPVADDGLLDFFRKRTPPAPPTDKLEALVKNLSSDDASVADRAQAELTAIGLPALPHLRAAANNADEVEAARRARACLSNIEGDNAASLVVNAARALAARKPAGAAKVLLDYLPHAEDNTSFQEIQAALQAVALRDGKPDPALLAALKDRVAIRRGTAAQVLSSVGGPAYYPAIRPLLKDSKPSVRLGVALGLVGAYDAEAVPVLIDSLADLPPSLRSAAEEYLNNLAGEWAVSGPKGHDMTARKIRRDVWASWWKNMDGSLLLDEFRSRIPSDDDREKIDELIRKLDDADADKREAASRELIGFGKKAASQLRRASGEGHPRIGPFAARCLDTIEKDEPSPLPGAAARLLALRKPEGAVEALLAYVAVSESEETTAHVIDILASIGCPGGKADETLLKALGDRAAARRAAAVQAICKAKATGALPRARRLLTDKDPLVKLRAAQALAAIGEKEALPTLISLLTELPQDQVWEAEDLLARVAGDKAPSEAVTAEKESRVKATEAWNRWWKENAPGVDLAKVEMGERDSGRLIVVENWNRLRGRGRVMEVDQAGKVRWEVPDLNWPWDAQVLRNGNVLVIEQQNRVTERDRKNKVLWDKVFSSVFHVDRLPNGHTFVGCRNALLIVDKDGKNVFSHYYNINSILAAKRFRDGSMAYVSYSGHYVRLDRAGKQVKTFNLPWAGMSFNGAEILPGDRVVVGINSHNKVVEYTADGKELWSAAVVSPNAPFRMSNGHTLVAGNGNTIITEIDRRGKIVKEWKGLSYNPFRVIRR